MQCLELEMPMSNNYNLTCRDWWFKCSPMKAIELFDVIKKDAAKMRAIEEMGFLDILKMQCKYMSKALVTWIVNHMSPNSMTIKFGDSVFQVTAEDVNLIMGVPLGDMPMAEGDGEGLR